MVASSTIHNFLYEKILEVEVTEFLPQERWTEFLTEILANLMFIIYVMAIAMFIVFYRCQNQSKRFSIWMSIANPNPNKLSNPPPLLATKKKISSSASFLLSPRNPSPLHRHRHRQSLNSLTAIAFFNYLPLFHLPLAYEKRNDALIAYYLIVSRGFFGLLWGFVPFLRSLC